MTSRFHHLGQNHHRRTGITARRRLLCFLGALLLAAGLNVPAASAEPAATPASTAAPPPAILYPTIPRSGEGMTLLDPLVLEMLDRYHVPGASLAVVKDGRLVVAKGYGWANVAKQEPVTPRTLFSLASLSKPIGAIAILRLVDMGRLKLDDRVYDVLGRPAPLGSEEIVPRARQITVREILNHSAGWLRPHDPLAGMDKIARQLHLSKPVPSEAIVRWAFSHPLDFTPGAQQSYSNFSYQLLRHVCQSVNHQPFEQYVRLEILMPLGITDMCLEPIGPGYAKGEAHRYRTDDWKEFGGGRAAISPPGGSWLASSVDMARLMAALDSAGNGGLLSPATMHEMLAPPAPPLEARPDGSYFGLGWDTVLRTPAGIRYSKNGGVAGISTFAEHDPNGVDWVLLMNGASGQKQDPKALAWIVPRIRQAVMQNQRWPDGNLFGRFFTVGE
jgi:N-acyl-D-amino-acid deacylase